MSLSKIISAGLLFFVLSVSSISGQSIRIDEIRGKSNPSLNRERGLHMLKEVKQAIEERYYDKNFRGINLDERFKAASEKIKKLDANWQILGVIAQVVLEFDDSHTTFYPPDRSSRTEYGFSMQMIGQNCVVIDVKKGSDAEAKGLKVGDVVVGIGRFNTTRDNLWKINYLLYQIDPQEFIKVYTLNPDKTERELTITASIKTLEDRQKESDKKRREKLENPYKCQAVNQETIACKLRTFSVDKKIIDKMMGEVGTHQKLILDLRGNGGGYVKIEEYLTGHFFEEDTKIATFVMRDKTKERIAKSQKDKVYKGDLAVLIDSNSASASEVFARVIQLHKRGKIVGDISAGAVMTSNFISMANVRGVSGYETYSFFGMSLTIADLIMSDGNRLEKTGVVPDYLVGPTSYALAQKSDPILSYAAKLLGSDISPEDAGKFYFLTKKTEADDDVEEDGEGGN